MRRFKSSVPKAAVETPVGTYKQEGAFHEYQVKDCLLNGNRVGQRLYNERGILVLETPIREGLKHGWEVTWDDEGRLLLIEPYVKGKIHGTAEQYGNDGRVIGTYTLIYGTGFDIWRQESEDKTVYIAEIHSLQDGMPHGYEWHFASPKQDLWHERHWYMGTLHGIERIWNSKGRLRRGYPRFYISDQPVSRQRYLRRSAADRSLPVYREEDNLPHRNFLKETVLGATRL